MNDPTLSDRYTRAAERYDERKLRRKRRARRLRQRADAQAALIATAEELLWLLTNWRHRPKGYDVQGAFGRARTAIAAAKAAPPG